MKAVRYRTIKMPDGSTKQELAYGSGLANTLAYMLKGFRGWQCFGLVAIQGPHNFGVAVDGVPMCALYGTRMSTTVEADDSPGKEQAQIDAGKHAVVLFYGSDNTSVMRRMTPEQYDELEISHFERLKNDLFYNS